MLSGISQSEKEEYHMSSFMGEMEETKQTNTEKKKTQTKKQTPNYREQTEGSQSGRGGLGQGHEQPAHYGAHRVMCSIDCIFTPETNITILLTTLEWK